MQPQPKEQAWRPIVDLCGVGNATHSLEIRTQWEVRILQPLPIVAIPGYPDNLKHSSSESVDRYPLRWVLPLCPLQNPCVVLFFRMTGCCVPGTP